MGREEGERERTQGETETEEEEEEMEEGTFEEGWCSRGQPIQPAHRNHHQVQLQNYRWQSSQPQLMTSYKLSRWRCFQRWMCGRLKSDKRCWCTSLQRPAQPANSWTEGRSYQK